MVTSPSSEQMPEDSIAQHNAETVAAQRHDWIATYAFFLAETRGFTPEFVLNDWLEAERAYMDQGLAKGESD